MLQPKPQLRMDLASGCPTLLSISSSGADLKSLNMPTFGSALNLTNNIALCNEYNSDWKTIQEGPRLKVSASVLLYDPELLASCRFRDAAAARSALTRLRGSRKSRYSRTCTLGYFCFALYFFIPIEHDTLLMEFSTARHTALRRNQKYNPNYNRTHPSKSSIGCRAAPRRAAPP
ncbi:hypothetical protein EVAR_21198_1 [Eumeta japonica]|uniref:Uncharacterized protein n=1 Tax=Eumeta variegata TaxID=151549 RepID=A0A4C1UNN3_EUMVA|nr:hypothetical protein EVAR_21198_1 [Eumeta japonica]